MGNNLRKIRGMYFQKIYRLKKDSDLQRHSKKSYSQFIQILQAKGHFYYLNEGYPFYECIHAVVVLNVEYYLNKLSIREMKGIFQ